MKYRTKTIIIEAITFDELIEYGITQGENVVSGMPWSFKYNGHSVTHESDECYLISSLKGTFCFTIHEMLITRINGEMYSCNIKIFEATYERIGEK